MVKIKWYFFQKKVRFETLKSSMTKLESWNVAKNIEFSDRCAVLGRYTNYEQKSRIKWKPTRDATRFKRSLYNKIPSIDSTQLFSFDLLFVYFCNIHYKIRSLRRDRVGWDLEKAFRLRKKSSTIAITFAGGRVMMCISWIKQTR